jgi:hypothetical protein
MLRSRISGIDILKTIAIIYVICLHSEVLPSCPVLLIGLEMPLFMLLFGTTRALSDNLPTSEKYILDVMRVVIPAAPFIAVLYFTGKFAYHVPGDYFIPLIIELVLIFPLLLLAYRKFPLPTLVGSFIINILFNTASTLWIPYDLYRICFVRYIFAVCLGMYLRDAIKNKNPDWNIMLIGTVSFFIIISQAYLLFPTPDEWAMQTPVAFGYVLLVSYLIIRMKIQEFEWVFRCIGENIYSIFLWQTMFFAFVFSMFDQSIALAIFALVFSIFIGVLYGKITSIFFDKLDIKAQSFYSPPS